MLRLIYDVMSNVTENFTVFNWLFHCFMFAMLLEALNSEISCFWSLGFGASVYDWRFECQY